MACSSVVVAHDVEDRREGLFLHDRRASDDLDQRGAHVRRRRPARPRHALAAATRAALLLRRGRARVCMASKAGSSISGPTERARRRADRRWASARRRRASRVDEHRRRSTACTIRRRSDVQRWPHVPTAANTIARTRQLEVGRGRDDQRVVAAELEQRAPEPRATRLRHGAPHAHRAGRRDQRQAVVARQAPDRRRRAPMTTLVSAGGHVGHAGQHVATSAGTRAPQAASSPTASRPPGRRTPARAPRSRPTPRPGN